MIKTGRQATGEKKFWIMVKTKDQHILYAEHKKEYIINKIVLIRPDTMNNIDAKKKIEQLL